MDDQAAKRTPRTGGRRSTEETRRAILRAAQKEFSQQGYSGARIDKIASTANCNVRMIYHYFSSKQKLYITVLEDAYSDLRAQEGNLQIDIEKPVEGLLKLLRFTFDYFEKNPNFEGILRAENVMRGRFVRNSARVVEMGFPLRKTISDLIASGERQGVLRADLDPVHLYVTIAALSRFHLSSAFSLSAVMGTDLTRAEWRKSRWTHAAEVFRAYLFPPGAGVSPPEAGPGKDPAIRTQRKPRAAKAPATAAIAEVAASD
jgi:AcrR family transcriptional regulator